MRHRELRKTKWKKRRAGGGREGRMEWDSWNLWDLWGWMGGRGGKVQARVSGTGCNRMDEMAGKIKSEAEIWRISFPWEETRHSTGRRRRWN